MSAAWGLVDAYIASHLVPEDDALASALDANEEAGLPPIDVAPVQGKLLHLLARGPLVITLRLLGVPSAADLDGDALSPDHRARLARL